MRSELRILLSTLLLIAACGGGDDTPDARVLPADGGDDQADAMVIDEADAMVIETPDATPADAAGPDDSIRDVQNGTIPTGSTVTLAGVVVTARKDSATNSVIFVQEPSGAPEFSGVMVFIDTDPAPAFTVPAVGDLVTIEGTVSEFTRANQPGSRTNIDPVTSITIHGTQALPAPVTATAASLVFGQPGADEYQGVLVRIAPVTVASQDAFGEFTIQDGLKVDDRLFAYTQPFAGDTFTSLTGPLDHDFGTSRVLPRSAADLAGYVASAPLLTDLSPASISVAPGDTTTLTVTIDRAAPAGGTVIDLSSDDASVAAPQNASVTVAAGQTTATFDVVAGNSGTTNVNASLGATTLSTSVQVSAVLPTVASLDPASIAIGPSGGTGILTVTLDRAAPAGGTTVTIASDSAGIAAPTSVLVPAGATQARFRVRAEVGTAAVASVTASANSSMDSSTVAISLLPSAPQAGELVINEVLANPGTTAGDASCDGVSSSTGDEFIEIVNVSVAVLDLTGVSVFDQNGLDNATARHVFGAFLLGPGEAVLVYGGGTGGAIGGSTTAAWCSGATATRIGDAQAAVTASSGSLSLNNSTETIYLRLAATDLDSPFVYASSTSATSVTRAPDGTGALVLHTAAAGHATDRNFTPGTLLTGLPFASASP